MDTIGPPRKTDHWINRSQPRSQPSETDLMPESAAETQGNGSDNNNLRKSTEQAQKVLGYHSAKVEDLVRRVDSIPAQGHEWVTLAASTISEEFSEYVDASIAASLLRASPVIPSGK
jgi:hypothetical protein